MGGGEGGGKPAFAFLGAKAIRIVARMYYFYGDCTVPLRASGMGAPAAEHGLRTFRRLGRVGHRAGDGVEGAKI